MLPHCSRTPRRTAGRSARTATRSAPRPPGGARPRCEPPGKRRPLSRRRTAAAAACGSRVVRDRDRGAVAGGDVRVLHDARHPPDVLEKGSRGHAGIAAVERRHESLEQPGEPARSEEHTSELQSPCNLVCRLLLEKKKTQIRVKPSAVILEDECGN